MPDLDDAPFVLVTNRRGRRRPKSTAQPNPGAVPGISHESGRAVECDLEELQQRFDGALRHLCTDEKFWTAVVDELRQNCPFAGGVRCYGLGRPSVSRSSVMQLALLKLLHRHLSIASSAVVISDPVLSPVDRGLIEHLGFVVSPINDRALHRVTDGRTFFYMPHCGRPLYENLLYANFTCPDLHNVVILGNSFCGMRLNDSEQAELPYLCRFRRVSSEWPLPMLSTCERAFNDTVIMRLSHNQTVDSQFWKRDPVHPKYCALAHELI